MCYASRTGTKRNLDGLRAAGWGILLSPAHDIRDEGLDGFPLVLDNGKWTAHTTGKPWDEARFLRAVEVFGERVDWTVVPDIVAGGLASLELTAEWLPRLRGASRLLLIAVQDGMRPEDVRPLLGPGIGIFLGGSTDWKLAQMETWGAFAEATGSHFHVARVNTVKRMYLAAAAGAHSTDGSGPSRFAVELARLQNARHQRDLFSPEARREPS